MLTARAIKLILFIALGVALVYLAEPVSQWVEQFNSSKNRTSSVETPAKSSLGWIRAYKGSIWMGRNNKNPLRVEQKDLALFPFDELFVDTDSNVEIELNSQSRIRILSNSYARFEQQDPTNSNSPIIVHLPQGSWQLHTTGKSGSFYVINKGKKETVPSSLQKSARPFDVRKDPTRTVFVNSSLTLNLDGNKKPGETEEVATEDKNTLTNEYIDRVIAKKRRVFQNCQTNALRKETNVSGELFLEITIEKSGFVSSVNIQKNTLNNAELAYCITEIFRRIRFRRFQGNPIVKTYPIVFE